MNPCLETNQLIQNSSNEWVIKNYDRLKKLCPETANHIPSIIPIKNLSKARFTSGYGNRKHPILKSIKHHGGVDIACSDTIIVTASGTVTIVAYDIKLGNYIKVNHGNAYETTYGHLAQTFTKVGEKLSLGSPIGIAGATGLATGNHLHYSMKKNGVLIDPLGNLLLYYR